MNDVRTILRSFALLLLAVGCLGVSAAVASAMPLLEAERAVVTAERTHAEALTRFERAAQAYQAELQAIERLQREVVSRPRELRTLQAALAASQTSAERLIGLEADVRQARAELERRRTLARSALQAELTARHGAPAGSAAARERRALGERLEALAAPLPPFRPAPLQAIVSVPYETPEQLRAAAAELEDALGSVQSRLERIDTEVEEARTRDRVVRRARGFATDERFLDDGERPRIGPRVAAASAEDDAGADRGAPAVPEAASEAAAEEPAQGGVAPSAPQEDFAEDAMPPEDAAPGAGAGADPEGAVPPDSGFVERGSGVFVPAPDRDVPRGSVDLGSPTRDAAGPRLPRADEDDVRDRRGDEDGRTDRRRNDPRGLEAERAVLEAERQRIDQARQLLLRRAAELERLERAR